MAAAPSVKRLVPASPHQAFQRRLEIRPSPAKPAASRATDNGSGTHCRRKTRPARVASVRRPLGWWRRIVAGLLRGHRSCAKRATSEHEDCSERKFAGHGEVFGRRGTDRSDGHLKSRTMSSIRRADQDKRDRARDERVVVQRITPRPLGTCDSSSRSCRRASPPDSRRVTMGGSRAPRQVVRCQSY